MKRICELKSLVAHASIRFGLGSAPGGFGANPREGFLILADGGAPRGYLNLCPHRAQPVDVGDGKLFLPDGNLECQAHGAVFDPATGVCVRGPCEGDALTPLRVVIAAGAIFVDDSGQPDELFDDS